MNRRCATIRCLVWSLCLSSQSLAQPALDREPVRVSYHAGAGCPSQAEFEALVSTRVSFPWLAEDRDLARPLRVVVTSDGGTWKANLEFRGQQGAVRTRTLSAADCNAAVGAIALATALLLDPQPSTSSSSLPASSDAAPAFAPARLATPEVLHGSAMRLAMQRFSPRSSIHPELGAGFGITSGIGSDSAYGATLFGGFDIASTMNRLGIAAHDSGFASTWLPDVKLRIRLLSVRFEHCPLTLRVADGVKISACFCVESGLLSAEGRANATAEVVGQNGKNFWLMPGLSPRLGFEGRWLFAELGPELYLPITQRRFAVRSTDGSSRVAYETPSLALGGQTSVGLRFQ